jgi:3-oxoacyl-[acyl-carrier protein] reductase
MDLKLRGKSCFVMSSSKGIGKGIALSLAKEGVEIILSSSNERNLSESSEEIKQETGITPKIFRCDVRTIANYLEQLNILFKEIDGVDILITNAPGPKPINCDDLTENDLQEALDVNIKSQVLVSQLAIPYMIKKRWGRLIHLTSTTAREPEEGMVLSNLTRAAVGSYSKTAAREYGKHGITSNTILTGGVLTERARDLAKIEAIKKNITVDEVLKESMKLFPTGYFPEPNEFGRIITFLCSPNANFINGVSLPLDGGILRGI